MAVVSPVPAIAQGVSSIRYPDISGIMASSIREIVGEEPTERATEDTVYVAVGKDVKQSKSTLIYALQNSGGKKICIIYVLVPAQMIPLMGTKFPASSLKEQEVRAYREIERQNMHKILDEYLLLCRRAGARAEKLHIESESIEKGIVELISLHGIKKLVMGAAADKYYSRKMMDLKSKKAIYVRQQASAFCHIQFICKGHLIHTREGKLQGAHTKLPSPSQQASPNSETGQSSYSRSQSLSIGKNDTVKLSNPALDLFRRVRSFTVDQYRGTTTDSSSSDITEGFPTPKSRLYVEAIYDDLDGLSRRSPSELSSSRSSSSGLIDIGSTSSLRVDKNENEAELNAFTLSKEDPHRSSHDFLDGSANDSLYNQLEQAMMEAAKARREAFEEALRRGKAEKEAINAIRRVKVSESLYAEELKQRKAIEEALAKEREELDNMKNQRNRVMEELQIAQNQKSILESQIAESDQMVKELEQKILSAVELLENYKKERDELQLQRDGILREVEEMRKNQGDALNKHMPQFFYEFSLSEIEEATQKFDPTLKIGEGGYGSIYKGLLRHTEVAIKTLHSRSMQGPSEFQQEVDVLSKIRHTNLVTLIGACPEAWALIYEYLPNGSLEDRLVCKNNTSPLSYQTRIRIATDLCSALIFLHSSKPHGIIHGDLKPANILLDGNYVCKLGDFGICRLLSHHETSNNATLFCKTDPKGTFAYMDPEFLSSGELSTKSDVYSFGIILLRLLTGKPALGITKEVQYALDAGKLKSILDPLAGDWPFVQAEQLAHLALRCCDINRRTRPELRTDVWRVLEPMRASCGGSLSFRMGSEERCQPPPYFTCPIFQEVMLDPHVAADGFTYEAEALRGWLDSGHDTSPMTNLKLENHDLVPNRALRSAIQEWLQRR